ncbi:DUF3348 family protein [Rhodoferax sp.]|uniref:DUF3348 family protein n=1 Tax=Rhodoferax sp. TaxID=50421 RepID=UPI0025F94E30|nr:DUF3348 family protein [Rhodoferax sp.]
MQGRTSPSGLVGLMEAWAAVDTRAPRQDWAEHWSAWLGPLDAIALSTALPGIRSASMGEPAAAGKKQAVDLAELLRQLREDLTRSIRQLPAPQRPGPRSMPLPNAVVEPAADEDYGSYRQRYIDIQRRLELRIDPLREHCRDVLSRTSPRLSQLAQLDATLETMLAPHAQALLATLAALLERRFHRYRQDESLPMADFEQDFQDALVAELHFRLEPVAGLVEAWRTGA